MDDNEHVLSLGKLITNLLSLEFAIRVFLFKHHGESEFSLFGVNDGDEVPSNYITNYSSLDIIIKKFNKICEQNCPEYRIDKKVVDIRDMVAHGRIASKNPTPPYQLIKFGKMNPQNMMIPVEHVVLMNSKWLNDNINFVKAIFEEKVIKASKCLGYDVFNGD